MNVEGDFGAREPQSHRSSSSSARALAAAGADAMRCRLDELVALLRGAIDDVAWRGHDPIELGAKLAEALDVAEDVRYGLGQLTFVSRADGGKACNVDVHEPLELALRMTRSIVGRRARLVRRYEAVPAVHADKTALLRVFAQLLQNAADSIPPYMPLANCIAVRTYVDAAGCVAIEVADTGVGLAEESVGRVFEPFFTTKSGAAAGLGLTIARGEVLAAGGTIVVDSVEGRGSRFTVRLPAVAGSTGTLQCAFSSELPHRRVMVVADDPNGGDRLRAMFADTRTVVVVAALDEAVDRLGMGEACDLVVIDVNDEGCAELRERLADVAPEVVMRTFEVRAGHAAGVRASQDSSSGLRSVAAQ